MSLMFQVCFKVKNTPVVPGKQVYILINRSKNIKYYQMEKNNEFYQIKLDLIQKANYQYKYLVVDNNEQRKEERGYRNFFYGKQDLQMMDSWNKKEVIMRIYKPQQSIINGLKIKAHQKFNQKTLIKQSEIELRQIKHNKTIYYEAILFAECALNILEFEFFFNAVNQAPCRLDQQYTNSIMYYYSILKTVGNQSYVDIQQEDLERLSCKPIVNQSSQQIFDNFQNLSENYTFSKELQYDKIQNLMQIFETSIQNYSNKLQAKDKQIKELQLEKLFQDEIIFFNYQDAFQPDVIGEIQNEFYLNVKDLQKQNNSIFIQFKEDLHSQEQIIQKYEAQIFENKKTMDILMKKVQKEKKNRNENAQKIKYLEDSIKIYQSKLDEKLRAAEQLRQQLNEEKQNNQEKIIEKEKKFLQQIEVLDNEIQEFKRINETLNSDNQKTSKEKEYLMKLKSEQDEQLYTIKKDNRKLTENQEESQKELEEAQQIIQKQNDSLEIIIQIQKEVIMKLVNLCKNILKELTQINDQNEQKYNIDLTNLKNNVTFIDLGLQDFLEQKTTLQQVETNFQQQVQPQLKYLCSSVRIKYGEQMLISRSQIYIIEIFKVLKKLESIKEIMPRPKLILSRQTTEFSLKQIRSPYYFKLGLKESLFIND